MQKTFSETLEMWYKKFSEMKPGQGIDIEKIGKRDIELFTAICKSFIDAGNMDFEFSNDFKYFRRTNTF